MMKHLNIKFLFIVFMSMYGTKAVAFDMAIKNADSIVIFYNYINNDKELEVTCYSEDIVDPDLYYGNIVIPDEVTYKGKTLKVTSIGNKAFYGCEKLLSVSFPRYLRTIGTNAFCKCTRIQKIYIPESVTSIESSSFSGCNGLSSIIVDNGNMVFDSRYNCNAIIETKTNTLIVGCKTTTIPYSVNAIGSSAFSGCEDLNNIEIPKTVTEIFPLAFTNCTGLTSIDIPNTVTYIGYSAFQGCSNLTSIVIPPSITYISPSLLFGCSGLTSLTLPNTITSIEDYAFDMCIGLKSITIPNSVTTIGIWAFHACHALTSIVIPKNVREIKDYSFSYCINVESITIPSSVTKIGNGAFEGSHALKDVYCLAEKVPDAETSAFHLSIDNNKTLHVPSTSLDKYKNTYPWSTFGSIVAMKDEELGLDGVFTEQTPTKYYTLDGRENETGRKGLNILLMGDGKTKKQFLK